MIKAKRVVEGIRKKGKPIKVERNNKYNEKEEECAFSEEARMCKNVTTENLWFNTNTDIKQNRRQ